MRPLSVVSANYISTWDGSNWSALGSAMNNEVRALAVSGQDVYAGGNFTTAGGQISAYAARAYLGDIAVIKLQTGVPGPATNTILLAGIPGYQYITQFATNLMSSPWFNLSTNAVGTNGIWTVIDPTATNSQRFYRTMH